MFQSKNRLGFTLLLSCLLCTHVTIKTKSTTTPSTYNITPTLHDINLQKKLSQYRILIIPTIIALTLYFNKENLIRNITEYPVHCLAISYLIGNYVIDTFSKYRQLNQSLQFFIFSQTMTRYMLCIHAILNSMKQLYTSKNDSFNEQAFLETITHYTGHSLDDLERFNCELLNSSTDSIHNACINISPPNLEEKTYMLFKEKITIEQMLIISKDDPIFYPILVQFYSDPEKNYESIIITLCKAIQSHFNYFMKKNLHFD